MDTKLRVEPYIGNGELCCSMTANDESSASEMGGICGIEGESGAEVES